MTVDPKDVATLGAKLDAWIALETALREDLMGVLDLLDHAPDNQSLRRALIRSLWGFVEGSIYGVSDYLRTAHSLANDGMEGPPDRAKTLERVKAVLKEAARDLAGWKPHFGTPGWSAMRASLRTRDHLMHPKNAKEVQISDPEVDVARDAAGMVPIGDSRDPEPRVAARATTQQLTPVPAA